MSANIPGEISADGQHYWNGQEWVTTLSPDGKHRWNGKSWVSVAPPDGPPAQPAPSWLPLDAPGATPAALVPPPPPAGPPPAGYAPPPPGYPPPGGYTASRPAAPVNRGSLAFQFGGIATWSIVVGAVGVLLPLISSGHTYFLILPIFGLYRAYMAFRVGRTWGAVTGFVLNLGAGLSSLLASGLLQPPSQ